MSESAGRAGRMGHLVAVLRRGVQLVRQAAPRLLLLTTALQVLVGLGTIGAVVAGSRVADRLLKVANEGSDQLRGPLVAFLVVTLVVFVASRVKAEYQRVLAERTERHARDIVLEEAVRAPLIRYESPEFHDQLLRALSSAATRPVQLVAAILGLVSSGVTVIGLGAAVIALSPRVLAIIVIGVVPLWWTARRATQLSYDFNVAQSERDRQIGYFLTTLASRNDAGEVRVFGIGDELRRRLFDVHGRRLADLARLARSRALLGVTGAVVSVVIGGLVLWTLADLFESGSIGVDQAALAAGAFLVLSQRLQTLNSSAASVLECALFLEDLERFAPAARLAAAPPGETAAIDRISLDAVSFRYPAGTSPAVTDVTLDLHRGELVALVGENGSGKTTVAHLLSLLYEPTAGAVLINGEAHDAAQSTSRRRSIATVHQHFLRLVMSAAENIAMGDLGAIEDRQRIATAAQFAGISSAVEALPAGYDTLLGTEFSEGLELSGGQWQRLAIARAWFRDADLLIFDEPTSSLDPAAEVELIENLRSLASDKLVVLISHRFGTVSSADRIVVLHEGRVVEQGAHDDLMADAGLYASMYTMQADTFR